MSLLQCGHRGRSSSPEHGELNPRGHPAVRGEAEQAPTPAQAGPLIEREAGSAWPAVQPCVLTCASLPVQHRVAPGVELNGGQARHPRMAATTVGA